LERLLAQPIRGMFDDHPGTIALPVLEDYAASSSFPQDDFESP